MDLFLTELGLAESRARAQALILAGLVYVNGVPAKKAGDMVDDSATLTVKGKDHPYVSRGGVKLAHALDTFHIDPTGMTCLDVGASTGGFTDCLLQRGAAKVWALDVGDNQLDYRLRVDPRVVSFEGMNARLLDVSVITDAIDMLVADVSFISLKLAIPPALPLLKPGATLVMLAKPQFEVGRENVGKGGVVKDQRMRDAALGDLREFFTGVGLEFLGECESPITGRKGNVEYFIVFRKGDG